MTTGLTETKPLTEPAQRLVDELDQMLRCQFGTPFFFYSLKSLDPLSPHSPSPYCPMASGKCLADLLEAARKDAKVQVADVSDVLHLLVVPFDDGREPSVAAVGLFASQPGTAEQLRVHAALLFDGLLPEQPICYCQAELLLRLGEAVRHRIAERRRCAGRERELLQLAAQVSQNYEEITLLYQLTRQAQVSRDPSELNRVALVMLADVLPAQQVALAPVGNDRILSEGNRVLTNEQIEVLVQYVSEADLRRPYVNNHVSRTELARRLPELERVVAVAVTRSDQRLGLLLALNPASGPALGSVEASLMSAVAAILATHHTNVRLFHEIEDLFLGIVRALSSAIDAKDPYTRGHSERVARLARRLGQELGLPDEERDLLYLSGLLHDVGKIGVRDAVLQKPGRLTEEEFEHIKRHALTGFEILCGLRQLTPILPGVRSHHEAVNGCGYPDRLKDSQIPLIARIIAVADAYDAMTSDRCYRTQLSPDKVERIFRDGAGKQWDAQIVELLLKLRHEIPELMADVASDQSTAGRQPPAPSIRIRSSRLLAQSQQL